MICARASSRGAAVGVAVCGSRTARRFGRTQGTPSGLRSANAAIPSGLWRQNRYVARRNRARRRLNRRAHRADAARADFRGQDVRVIASSIRKGNIIEREDGQLCVVLSAESFHPGKGTPTTQIDMRRLSDGVKVTDRFKTTEQVERAFVEDKNFDYLYADGDGHHFMNDRDLRPDAGPGRRHRRPGAMAAGGHEGHPVDLQRDAGRDPAAAARDAGSHRDRAGDEGPDRVVVLQAGQALERRARHGAAAHHRRERASSSRPKTAAMSSAPRTDRRFGPPAVAA